MNRQCDIAFSCNGETDSPIANLSSEATDGISWRAAVFATWNPWNPFGFDPHNPNNPNVPVWFANNCVGQCLSLISLQDAILCAQRQAYLCTKTPVPTCLQDCYNNRATQDMTKCLENCEPPTTCTDECFSTINAQCLQPDGTLDQKCIDANQTEYAACVEQCFPPFKPFHNTAQQCSVTCPDGSVHFVTVAAGTYVADTQLLADSIAHEAACIQAYQIPCPGGQPPPPPPPPPPPAQHCLQTTNYGLTDATVGDPYSTFLAYTGNIAPPLFWIVVSGSLPSGLQLDISTGEIYGTPTTGGTAVFTVSLSNNAGIQCQNDYEIEVEVVDSCFSTGSNLPAATACQITNQGFDLSDAAKQSANDQFGPGWNLQWSLTGTLPPGLSFDSISGRIFGTPDQESAGNTYTFQVCINVTAGGGC